MDARDDFTLKTKQVMAQRAAFRCAICQVHTIGPHSNDEKSISIGRAAHICAASSGGPRYNASMTPEQRKHISNGIWVCATCSDKIDKDEDHFSATLLHHLKKAQEARAGGNALNPSPPQLTLQPRLGTPAPPIGPSTITSATEGQWRWFDLRIRNVNRTELLELQLRIQFPAIILARHITQEPRGANVTTTSQEDSGAAFTVGEGGSLEFLGRFDGCAPSDLLLIDIERLRGASECKMVLQVAANNNEVTHPHAPDERRVAEHRCDLTFKREQHGEFDDFEFFYEVLLRGTTFAFGPPEERSDDIWLPTWKKLF